MSYQLYPQHYVEYFILRSTFNIAGLAGCRCPSQTSGTGPRRNQRNQRSGGGLVACHRVILSPLRFARTPSDFIWLSRIRLAYRDVWIFRRIRRFFDRNRRRFRGCAKSGRSGHSKCHASQMPKLSQRKLSSMSSSVFNPSRCYNPLSFANLANAGGLYR
jgi:hypothetical protein